MDTPKGEETKMPGEENGGNGDWTGSSSSGDSAKEKKRYMQAYLQVIYNLYGKMAFSDLQQKLANQAYSIRLPASSYAIMLRRRDSMYVRSDEYKNRRQQAIDIYQRYRPNRVVPEEFINRYARSGMNQARLMARIQRAPWFKQRFPGWKQAVASGMITPTSLGAPTAYLALRDMLNNSFRSTTGNAAPTALHRMMFASGMSEADIAQNLAGVFGGKEALRFATGQTLDADDLLRAALTRKYGTGGIAKIAGAQKTAQGFFGSEARGFDVNLDQKTGNITMGNI